MHFRYRVDIAVTSILPKGELFTLTSPDWRELQTQGNTREEVLVLAARAINNGVAEKLYKGERLPLASSTLHHDYIEVSIHLQLKWALVSAFRESGLTYWGFGNKIQMREQQVEKLMDPFFRSDVDEMALGLKLLGKRASIVVL